MRRRQRLRALTEAEAYARCHGTRETEVRIVKLEPRRPRYDLPVSGDATYGVKGDLGLERQFLHAHRLRFVHPVTESEIDVESPLPEDLVAALGRARGGA